MSPENVINLPLPLPEKTATVITGRCSHCRADLNDLLLAVLRDEAELPEFCRQCGYKLNPPIIARVLRCGDCKKPLTLQAPDPERERNCSYCGKKLTYEGVELPAEKQ